MKAPEPTNETERLAALKAYQVLDTDSEKIYDDLTAIAAHICSVPMAMISLVDHSRQWFKARVGVKLAETPREVAFCAHAILQTDPLVVKDATLDPRFSDSALVQREPYIRFYAGFPLVTPDGFALGTLCAIDRRPRELSPEQTDAMMALARQVMALLEFRRITRRLAESLEHVQTLRGLLPICAWCKRIRNDQGYWTQVEAYIRENTEADFTHGICPECLEKERPKNQTPAAA